MCIVDLDGVDDNSLDCFDVNCEVELRPDCKDEDDVVVFSPEEGVCIVNVVDVEDISFVCFELVPALEVESLEVEVDMDVVSDLEVVVSSDIG